MRILRAAKFAAIVLTAMFLVAALAQAQNTTAPTLARNIPALYLYGPTSARLNSTQPTGSAGCGPGLLTTPGTNIPATITFTYDAMPFQKVGTVPNTSTMWHIAQAVAFRVRFVAADPQASMVTSGFNLTAQLVSGQGASGVREASVVIQGPATTTISDQTLTFAISDTNPLAAHMDASLQLVLRMTSTSTAPGPAANNVRVACGPDTKLDAFVMYRGDPGAQDLDGDGIPDAEDVDRDGDNVTNVQESAGAPAGASYRCVVAGNNVTMADDGELKPGRNSDFDGDGVPDEEECFKGSDPKNALSKPAVPKTLLDYLIPILAILIVLGLLAGIVWVYLKFGKIATVLVVSTPELFVPPGSKGKYEVVVEHLAKKGEPRTFQLSATGMPEGWDAKLNQENVTLELGGSEKAKATVWLEVEAPQHTDPESAVVIVKATPLNKAGRKESMKLVAKAETITSINVPPGSKVPVKRGGKVEAAEPASEAAATPTDTASRSVIDIEGIGGTYDAKLKKMGISTIGELRAADPVVVAKKTGANETVVRQWQAMGQLMEIAGIGPQYSELLVRAGVTSIPQLAEAKPKELAATIEKLSAERQVQIQGGPAGEKSVKNWVKAAGKWVKDHPTPAPAEAPAVATPPPETAAAAVPQAPPKPQLQVGGLKHEPASFRQGEAVKSSVNVQNNGAAASTIKLSLFVNDGLADVQTVTVKPGKTKDVQFKWTAQDKNKLNIRGEIVPG